MLSRMSHHLVVLQEENSLGLFHAQLLVPNRVFGWRAEQAGSERTCPRGCLDGRREGWVGPKRQYSAQMRVESVLRKMADGANPAEFCPTCAPPFYLCFARLLHATAKLMAEMGEAVREELAAG
jgi:hypothetical protein